MPPFIPRHVQITVLPGVGNGGVTSGVPAEQYVSPPYELLPTGYILPHAPPPTPSIGAEGVVKFRVYAMVGFAETFAGRVCDTDGEMELNDAPPPGPPDV